MSHHHHHDCCCRNQLMKESVNIGYFGQSLDNLGGYGASPGIRWIFALLILIVIVLQFGRNQHPAILPVSKECDGDRIDGIINHGGNIQAIDNSVLFIIVIFLLVLCSGCWSGGFGGRTKFAGYGYY